MEFGKSVIKEIGSLMDEHGIKYMVIGGQAVILHGQPRFTVDIDISVQLEPSQFEQIGFLFDSGILASLVDDLPDFTRRTFVLPARHIVTGTQLDIIFAVSQYEINAIDRRIRISLDGRDVYFISPEDLVIHKLLANRPVDIKDARSIIVRNEKVLDEKYLYKWIREFDETLDLDLEKTLDELKRQIRAHEG